MEVVGSTSYNSRNDGDGTALSSHSSPDETNLPIENPPTEIEIRSGNGDCTRKNSVIKNSDVVQSSQSVNMNHALSALEKTQICEEFQLPTDFELSRQKSSVSGVKTITETKIESSGSMTAVAGSASPVKELIPKQRRRYNVKVSPTSGQNGYFISCPGQKSLCRCY
ncbi:hypothetical protein AB6A40_008395 [Gnathostoma spinigerum]|uniref:Uncharacterized protein n=1 Tax=Gnathostoma spinigerum TaxID=75299 RepID=A0ABD6EW19_9BILA